MTAATRKNDFESSKKQNTRVRASLKRITPLDPNEIKLFELEVVHAHIHMEDDQIVESHASEKDTSVLEEQTELLRTNEDDP